MSVRSLLSRLSSLALVAPMALAAQAAPTVRDLPAPSKVIEEPYTLVAGLRELGQGRVAIVDAGEGDVSIVNFATGERAALGRQGAGPGEYRAPSAVFSVRGDTLWVMDPVQQRFTVYLPNLEYGVPFRFQQMFDQATRSVLTQPFFIDATGQLYASAMPVSGGPQMVIPDSVEVVRLDPRAATGRTSLTKVRWPTSGSPQMRVEGQVIHYSMAFPGLVTADVWAVFPDGRVAIVHGSNYTVEFIHPDGRRTTSRPIAYDRIPVTTADQTAEMDQARKMLADMGSAIKRNMPASMTLDIQMTPPAAWPAEYPAVSALQAFAAPDGRLWVMRSTPARLDRQRWDVIDATGNVVARWQLPTRTRLVGVGAGVVYTVKMDDDDLQQLQLVTIAR